MRVGIYFEANDEDHIPIQGALEVLERLSTRLDRITLDNNFRVVKGEPFFKRSKDGRKLHEDSTTL